MRKTNRTGGMCRRCREGFRPGDELYVVPELGLFCPDCMEALRESWKRVEGDVCDLC